MDRGHEGGTDQAAGGGEIDPAGVYVPRYGSDWETFLDSGPTYARIDARRMFTFHMDETPPD